MKNIWFFETWIRMSINENSFVNFSEILLSEPEIINMQHVVLYPLKIIGCSKSSRKPIFWVIKQL